MTEHALMIAFAALFTLGCMTIHALRAHAKTMTPALGFVAMGLTVVVALRGLAGLQPGIARGPVAGPYAVSTNAAASPNGAHGALRTKPAAKATAVQTSDSSQLEAAVLDPAWADRARPWPPFAFVMGAWPEGQSGRRPA